MSELLEVPWVWYPSVVIGFTLWTAAYMHFIGPVHSRDERGVSRQLAFHAGTLLGLLSLCSPIDALADERLFSAHMLQHLLLTFGVAPLWLLGLPRARVGPGLAPWLHALLTRITSPVPAWVILAGVMWIWNVPQLLELTLHNEGIHVLQHLTFIGGGLIGWWPIVAPSALGLPRPGPGARMLYIFFVAMACTGLGALLTFSREPLYPSYAEAPGTLGLSVMTDQRLGGLMMWLPTHMLLLLALALTFFRWFTFPGHRPGRLRAGSTL